MQLTNPNGAAATAASPLDTAHIPTTPAEQEIRGAWAPANAIEEHLARKISALAVTIENILRQMAAVDPSVPEKASLLTSFALTVARLQKTQSTLEVDLRNIQSQRGMRATHPITCEAIPAQADARPYILQTGPTGNGFSYKAAEPIVAPEEMPDEARQMLETHFGTRIYKPSERHNGKFMITPKLIEEIAERLRPAHRASGNAKAT